MTANVRKFAGKTPAWHELGIVKEEGWVSDTPATDVLTEIGAIVPYELVPVHITLNGLVIELAEYRAILRHPDDVDGDTPAPNVLNIVGKDYKLVQPDEFARILDPLAVTYPVQTAGVLGKGEKYWVCLNGDDFDFQGDPFNEYIFCHDDHTGGGAMRIVRTPVQVVCQNTWTMAMGSARSVINIPHSGDPAKRLEYLATVENILAAQRRETVDQFTALVNLKLDKESTAAILEAAYPDPAKKGVQQDYEETMARAQGRLDESSEIVASMHADAISAAEAYEKLVRRVAAKRVTAAMEFTRYNDEKPDFGNTAYNLVSALIEVEDFGGVKMPGTAKSTLFGPRAQAKTNALNTALRLAGYQRTSAN